MIVTAGILVGAYPRYIRYTPRTHLVEVDDPYQGRWPVRRVLCGRAAPENVTDDSTQWTGERPTCPVCARQWDHFAMLL